MQRILCVVGAFAAVLIYLIWWVTYAGIHFTPRYSVHPPGASAEVEGTSVRLVSLIRADQLRDAKGAEPALPEPGAVWVVAELEAVRHGPAQKFGCGMEALGPQQRVWTEDYVGVSRSTPDCELDPPIGQPVRFESIFMVPARYADELIGVALPDRGTAARTAVIRPP